MGVTSAFVYTQVDQAGTRRTEAWLTLEFTGTYATGGQSFDLSPYFRTIEGIQTHPMSGAEARTPISASGAIHIGSGSPLRATPVVGDYATPASTRFLLGGPVILSGVGPVADMLSGLAAAVSGVRFGARAIGY